MTAARNSAVGERSAAKQTKTANTNKSPGGSAVKPAAASAGRATASAGRAAAKPESRTALVRRARRINRELAELYPYAHPELDFENPFQLLVATVLSAQTTDLRVNQTTPALFAAYPTPCLLCV